MEAALGLIEVEGVAGIVLAADAAVKAAEVELLGWESTGGFTTVFLGGSLSSVQAALLAGAAAARQVTPHVVAAPLSRPEPPCRQQLSFPLDPAAPVQPGALGLLETRGYAVQVTAVDRMVKAAAVEVLNVLTVHNRVVCTLVQGDVGAVREAIAVAQQALAGYEHLLGTAVIPQPMSVVLQAFGTRPSTTGGGG